MRRSILPIGLSIGLIAVVVAGACVKPGPPASEPPVVHRETEPPRVEPEAGASASALGELDPCEGHDDLVIDPIEPIVSDWQGSLVVGGRGPVHVRWCGSGVVTVASVMVGSPQQMTMYEFDPEIARLEPGAALTVQVAAPAKPGVLDVVAVAADERALQHTARAVLESVEDPERISGRTECLATGGAWGPHGMLGMESCDRPTRDAGRRCTSDADCESFCIDDHDEPLLGAPPVGAEVPTCGPGQAPRLLVGRCFERTSPFGCRARLRAVTIECISPQLGRRAHMVCVD